MRRLNCVQSYLWSFSWCENYKNKNYIIQSRPNDHTADVRTIDDSAESLPGRPIAGSAASPLMRPIDASASTKPTRQIHTTSATSPMWPNYASAELHVRPIGASVNVLPMRPVDTAVAAILPARPIDAAVSIEKVGQFMELKNIYLNIKIHMLK